MELDVEQARGTAFGKTNVVAEHALVSGDLRTLSPEQLERTKQTMQEVVAAGVSFVASDVKAIIDGIGLMGRDGHTVNETADLTTLPSQTKRAALLLSRLTRRAGTTGR